MSKLSYANLRGKIVSTFGSAREFSKKMDMSEQTISNKLCGHTPFSKEDMTEWGDALGIAQKDYYLYFFD